MGQNSKGKCCHNFQDSLSTNLEGVIFQKMENFIGIAVRISYLPKLKFWIHEYFLLLLWVLLTTTVSNPYYYYEYFLLLLSVLLTTTMRHQRFRLTLRHKSCQVARVMRPRVWLVTVRFMRKWLGFRKLSSRYHLRESFTSWRQEVFYS